MPFTLAIKTEILGDYFGDSATKMGTPLEIGLSLTEPNSGGGGITEPVGGSYTRFSVPNTDAEWGLAGAGDIIQNFNEFNYPLSTGDWGGIGWFVIYQAGTPKFYDNITNAAGDPVVKTVLTGEYFLFLAGELKIQLPPITGGP